MANELQAYTTTGGTVYAVLLNSVGQIWNGSAFVAINGANWTSYDIALTEATAGIYLGAMPAVSAGGYAYIAYTQAGASPAITDTTAGNGYLEWDGTNVVDSVLDDVIDDTYTARQLMRLYASALAGLLSGGGTYSRIFRDLADTKDRITATVNGYADRTAVTLDLD